MQKNQQSQAVTQIKHEDTKIEGRAWSQHTKTSGRSQEPGKNKITGRDKRREHTLQGVILKSRSRNRKAVRIFSVLRAFYLNVT